MGRLDLEGTERGRKVNPGLTEQPVSSHFTRRRWLRTEWDEGARLGGAWPVNPGTRKGCWGWTGTTKERRTCASKKQDATLTRLVT